jgi:hypothetical protein
VLTSTTFQSKSLFRRLKRLWGELGYVQRRVFEIQTGVPTRPDRRPRISRTIDELNRLYAA